MKNLDYVSRIKYNLEKILNGEDIDIQEYPEIKRNTINEFFSKIFKK